MLYRLQLAHAVGECILRRGGSDVLFRYDLGGLVFYLLSITRRIKFNIKIVGCCERYSFRNDEECRINSLHRVLTYQQALPPAELNDRSGRVLGVIERCLPLCAKWVDLSIYNTQLQLLKGSRPSLLPAITSYWIRARLFVRSSDTSQYG